MPILKHRYTAIALNGVIYVGGGESKRRFCDQFICYDTTDGEWKEKAPLQFNSTNAILFTSNQRLYAVDNKSIAHKYDDDEDSWTQVSKIHSRCDEFELILIFVFDSNCSWAYSMKTT